MSDVYLSWSPDASVYVERRRRLAEAAATAQLGAIVVGPGADLHYLVGRTQGSHERMSALVLPADGEPYIVTPVLERPGWDGSFAADALEFRTWSDGENPYELLKAGVPSTAPVGVDDHFYAMHLLGLAEATKAMPTAAGPVIAQQRMWKSAEEKACLLAIGACNDQVQSKMAQWLLAGRTENQVAADISAALLATGHELVDFCIVGSGPNGASPHHDASDRVINAGEAVVVDIGGPAASGYFSDVTRTYSIGEPNDPEVKEVFEIVKTAQEAGFQAAQAGQPCENVDLAARKVIEAAGYGQYFITRTGHGIGLECHEHPYMVRGNKLPLEPGMSFSIEPGIYLPGKFGVRIEDCVIIDDDGSPLRLNNSPKELII